ncbi:MBL fold metallo-hydrolase [Novispirillum sp. DQ9]|uniref:MBL fold metallo-hydrolase n=1 Tax=Novispirillum sp. DQ9 TaxID=3398612 RepID=UPI003C7C59D2
MTDQAVLDYPIAEVPEGAVLVEVAPGVRWLRMPLPFALDHINLWVLDDGEGVVLVDTGVANDTTRALWDRVLAGPLAGRPVSRVICTHFHPDHMGLAGWLCPRLSAPLWATLGEWAYGSMLAHDATATFVDNQVAFYRGAGLDGAFLDEVRRRGNPYAARVVPMPPALRRIVDGERITIGGREWEVVVGRGHAPEHAALWCPALDLLISGDQVLPRISPNVSVWPQEPDADPLSLFMDSLAVFKARVPDSVLVLPSHGRPFRGLHARIDELLSHHDDRLADTLAACAEPMRAVDLVPVLFKRELDTHQTFFAVGEALSHLHRLVATGALAARRDEAGVVWFQKGG